ncbi:MAG: hypothetical protein ACTSQZ_07910 [Candidatus Thorarchaeota archaeon]
MVTSRTVSLQYYTRFGRQESIKVETGSTELDLSKRNMSSVDLSPLRYCQELQKLKLSNNELLFLDLSPTCACPAITQIDIEEAKFVELNVTPLLFNESVLDLTIPDKVMLTIDPVAAFTFSNRGFLNNKQKIRFNRQYDTLVEKEGWRSGINNTKHLLKYIDPRYHFTAQRGLLSGLGMEEISGYDGDPLNILPPILAKVDYENARFRIRRKIIRLLQNQIESGGSTHFLDIDRLVTTEAHVLVQSIIEARKKEIESLVVPITNGETDGRRIWSTAYGFKIMRESGFSPYKTSEQKKERLNLTDIQRALRGVGMKFTTLDNKSKKVPLYNPRFSKGLIYHLENIGRLSQTIEEFARTSHKIHDTDSHIHPQLEVEST